MTSYSKFPNSLDDSSSLPLATDGVTGVRAEVVNRHRDAIIKIETELGVNPSGTYSTVKARLDAIESGIDSGGGGISGINVEYSSTLYEDITTIEFAGAGVASVTNPSSDKILVTISGGGGGAAIDVEDSGSTIVSSVTALNFTGNSVVTNAGGGQANIDIPFLATQDDGVAVENSTDTLNFIGKAAATAAGSGNVNVEIPLAKGRIYRNTSALPGASVGNNTTAVFNDTSSLVALTNVTIAGGDTTLSPSKTTHYLVTGQLTLQVTADAVSAIIIEILLNGSTVLHTVESDVGVWGTGINRSFAWNFVTDLTSGNTVSVRWRHSGSDLSTTQLMNGDSLSWLAISSI